MGKKFSGVSQTMSRFRGWIQAGATLLTNLHLPNFLKGGLYQGAGKTVCVPGLNCYSCPAASGACPIGAFQAVVGSSKFSFSYYITGFLILLGVLLGRFICGFLCPFGWFQELLHKIPTKKLSTKKLKPLTYLKYAVLLVMVLLLPAFLVNDVGMGDPFFCKYLCPQGVLEGAIPLSLANSGIRAALGSLFTWKFSILLAVIVLTDPLRANAAKTIANFQKEGVSVKLISGDNPVTASAVAQKAGILHGDRWVDMRTVEESEIDAAAQRYTVFGRVTPQQKKQLIQAFHRQKHTVAMTGDGVNDVLALKESDCSIAMQSGSDAARNVSNIVLLDSNFASMPKIVGEGRRSINNIERSSVLFLYLSLIHI